MSRTKSRVAVLYNPPTLAREHPDSASEAGVVAAARAVREALKGHGLKPFLLAAAPPVERFVRRLARQKPDVVFNLVEGFGGRSGGEARVTALLELMGLPFTGCPPTAQALGRDKAAMKAFLRGLGLPTAPFAVVGPGDPMPTDLGAGPLIVKPASEDASLGIDQASVVTDPTDLPARVAHLLARHGPRALIEAYLPGREFNVGVLALPEPEALPIAEILYEPAPGDWPILTYSAKWAVGSAEDLASRPHCPADVEPDLADRIGRLAVAAFRALGCRDIARVDLRLDARGEPMILEVNPNPDLDPSAGWARALRVSGCDYAATLAALARQALGRGPLTDA